MEFSRRHPLETGDPHTPRFLADAMLGKLAKWLRVMGYDTHYRSYYPEGMMDELLGQERRLLSRDLRRVKGRSGAIFIHHDRVVDQLHQLKSSGTLIGARDAWFSRCLDCNVLLTAADLTDARENVPEYVFYQNVSGIRFCPHCRKYYWPGSHRASMINRLEKWGFN